MTFKVIRGQGQGEEMTSVPYRDYFTRVISTEYRVVSSEYIVVAGRHGGVIRCVVINIINDPPMRRSE